MNQEQLTKQIHQFLQHKDFIRIETLFFDFLVEKLDIEKPLQNKWQRIRDLLISPDGRNQQLAFQILEGQGFQKLQKELKLIFLGNLYNKFISELKLLQFYTKDIKRFKRDIKLVDEALTKQNLDEEKKVTLYRMKQTCEHAIKELDKYYTSKAKLLVSFFTKLNESRTTH